MSQRDIQESAMNDDWVVLTGVDKSPICVNLSRALIIEAERKVTVIKFCKGNDPQAVRVTESLDAIMKADRARKA
jgi:hypothetical protein